MKQRKIVLPLMLPLITVAAAHAETISGAAAPTANTPAPTAAPEATPKTEYLQRYRPQASVFELGMFGGLLFPSSSHPLEADGRAHQSFGDAGGELGARLAYFPLEFLGIEAEGAAMGAKVENAGGAGIWAARGHLVGQLTSSSVTPFLLVGAGALGANSREMGGASAFAMHAGAGVKVPLDELLSVRLDVRDTITKASPQTTASLAHSPEILLGLTFTLDRVKPVAPLPPPDTDADGIADAADHCPQEAGAAPDGCPADRDKDGIADGKDSCPNQAGLAPTGCPPPADSDGDGIVDPQDACPNQAGTQKDGCPDPDPDKDTISGAKDQCPDQPETVNGYQDDDGCPDAIPDAVKQFSGAIPGIEFDFGKAKIRVTSYAILDRAVQTLAEYPDVKIAVVGHTDNVGSRERNIELSRQRAEAVKAYLVGKHIDAARISADGVGPDQPVSAENTEAARAKNRRIEFNIVTR